jgi:hypothetical protein
MTKEATPTMMTAPKLTRVKRLDSVPLEKVEYTPEGFIVDTPIVTSVGIFKYHDPDGSVRRELRLPEYVFDEKSLATYEGKPVIITHDAGRVDKSNVTEEIVGTILTKGYQDGEDVRAKIIIHDTNSVKRSGFRELSLGYDLTLDETPGEWNGQPYDAIQTEIAINHLAVVREARAGEQARLNIDGRNTEMKGEQSMATKPNTKPKRKAMNSDEMQKSIAAFEERRKRRLDDADAATDGADDSTPPAEENKDEESVVAAETQENSDTPPAPPSSEDRVQLIKDRRDRRDADGDPDDPETAKGIIAHQDEDIEALLEIVEELQAKQDFAAKKDEGASVPAADCDPGEPSGGGGKEIIIKTDSKDEIKQRVKLGLIGRELHLDGLEDKPPLEAKKAVIKKLRPTLNLDGKGAQYIDVVYELALDERNSVKDTDYQRKQMFNADRKDGGKPASNGSAQSARERMIDRMMNGGNE